MKKKERKRKVMEWESGMVWYRGEVKNVKKKIQRIFL